MTQTDTTKTLEGKVHLRVHHPNAIFSFGVQNWKPLTNKVPNVLSAWVLGGAKKDEFTVIGGLNSGFDVQTHSVPFVGALAGLKHKKFTGYLDYCCKRSEAEVEGEVKEGEAKTKMVNSHEVKATFDSRLDKDLLVFGEATTDLTKLSSLVLGGEYDLGNDTKLKAKVINSNLINLLYTFRFLTKKTYLFH